MLDNPGLSLPVIARGLDKLSAPVVPPFPAGLAEIMLASSLRLASPQQQNSQLRWQGDNIAFMIDLQSRQTVLFNTKGIDVRIVSAGFIVNEAAMAPQRRY